ncbi:hypothetical protein BJ912DRAFT_235041 [Pholiota molesta]|nr:hypothetical protein BJ912DRAFT_235041 [Pholiota molesta]
MHYTRTRSPPLLLFRATARANPEPESMALLIDHQRPNPRGWACAPACSCCSPLSSLYLALMLCIATRVFRRDMTWALAAPGSGMEGVLMGGLASMVRMKATYRRCAFLTMVLSYRSPHYRQPQIILHDFLHSALTRMSCDDQLVTNRRACGRVLDELVCWMSRCGLLIYSDGWRAQAKSAR